MYFKQLQPSVPYQDTSYQRSRIQMPQPSFNQNQKPVSQVVVKRDITPNRETKESCFLPKSNSRGSVSVVKQSQQQFPVQIHHIKLNQLEENYQSQQYQMQQIDITPQRGFLLKEPTQIIVNKQSQSKSSEIVLNPPRKSTSTNSNIKQHQQTSQQQPQPLKEFNPNLPLQQVSQQQMTPLASQNNGKKFLQVSGESLEQQNSSFNFSKPKQNSVRKDLQSQNGENQQNQKEILQQFEIIRKQMENMCQIFNENNKKNDQINERVTELYSIIQNNQNEQERRHIKGQSIIKLDLNSEVEKYIQNQYIPQYNYTEQDVDHQCQQILQLQHAYESLKLENQMLYQVLEQYSQKQ